MSMPLTDLAFDDEIERARAQFLGAFTTGLAEITGE